MQGNLSVPFWLRVYHEVGQSCSHLRWTRPEQSASALSDKSLGGVGCVLALWLEFFAPFAESSHCIAVGFSHSNL